MIRTAAMLAAALVLVLGAAACGSSSSSSDGDTTPEATPTRDRGASASGTLDGEVGPGFTIEVKQNGADAETVKTGTYTLKVEDKSGSHNFHLLGPGVDNEVTDVPFSGEKTVTVMLKPGTYTYQCDPHVSAGMKGTFKVT
ncbi:MAG TPA: plastocyanin/azurin family copper-binding protein [Gaiellaceae bacterium]|nr:plastocyanin/azurin family copper-binding protein [Gaiellaceae bacterium]